MKNKKAQLQVLFSNKIIWVIGAMVIGLIFINSYIFNFTIFLHTVNLDKLDVGDCLHNTMFDRFVIVTSLNDGLRTKCADDTCKTFGNTGRGYNLASPEDCKNVCGLNFDSNCLEILAFQKCNTLVNEKSLIDVEFECGSREPTPSEIKCTYDGNTIYDIRFDLSDLESCRI